MVKRTNCPRRMNAVIKPRRWAAYATAGAASALSCASTAEADVMYSGVIDRHFDGEFLSARFPLTGNASLIPIHIGPGEEPAFEEALIGIFAPLYAGQIAGLLVYGGIGYNYASKLAFGQNISTRQFVNGFADLAIDHGPNAQWQEPGTGFVGFRFDVGQGVQYGWARINMDGAEAGNTFTLIDYAFADSGERITSGQTTSTSVPESGGSLGLLALGCVGLLAWRARRSGVAG